MSAHLRRLRERIGHDLITLPSATACIVDESGRLLLARHDEGVWVSPGGAIEPNERPLDAVRREAREETGLSIEPRELLGVFGGPEFQITYRNGDRVSYVCAAYLCDVIGGEPTPDRDEVHELRWVHERELSGLELPAWARIVLPAAFRRVRP
ncbi:NUDIX domain-containing protein [Pseudonocardia acaciae]|uniref:NUDIX domain-containing protein n=1 Tax=Pseudonocardia acaciae TaxID=551276 RepID=UPI000685388D|nr:NUDIX domain-containing protein [Pseudonocardia acaciae]